MCPGAPFPAPGDWQWHPLLARIGVPFDLTMTMAGFYPQGGGELQAQIRSGDRTKPLMLTERGLLRLNRGLSAVANLLRHDTIEDRWEMTLYDNGRRGDTRLFST